MFWLHRSLANVSVRLSFSVLQLVAVYPLHVQNPWLSHTGPYFYSATPRKVKVLVPVGDTRLKKGARREMPTNDLNTIPGHLSGWCRP